MISASVGIMDLAVRGGGLGQYAVNGQHPIIVADVENGIYGLGDGVGAPASVPASDVFATGTDGVLTATANAHAPNIQTVIFRATMPNPMANASEILWSIDGGALGSSFTLRAFNASNTIHMIVTNTAQQANINAGVAADGATFIAAGRFALNDFSLSLDGASVVTDTVGTEPTVDTIRVGEGPALTDFAGTVLQIGFFTAALSDADLESASASWGA